MSRELSHAGHDLDCSVWMELDSPLLGECDERFGADQSEWPVAVGGVGNQRSVQHSGEPLAHRFGRSEHFRKGWTQTLEVEKGLVDVEHQCARCPHAGDRRGTGAPWSFSTASRKKSGTAVFSKLA